MQSLEYHLRVNKERHTGREDKHDRKSSKRDMNSFSLLYRTQMYKFHIKEMNVNSAKWKRSQEKEIFQKVPLFISIVLWSNGAKNKNSGHAKTCVCMKLEAVPTLLPGKVAVRLLRKTIVWCRKAQVKLPQLWSDSKEELNRNVLRLAVSMFQNRTETWPTVVPFWNCIAWGEMEEKSKSKRMKLARDLWSWKKA